MRVLLLAAALLLAIPSAQASTPQSRCKGQCKSAYGFCMKNARTKAAKKACKASRKTCKQGCSAH